MSDMKRMDKNIDSIGNVDAWEKAGKETAADRKQDTASRIFLSPPHIGNDEIQFVQEAFNSNYIAPLGPQVDAFEQEFSAFTEIHHCAALASGTAAMHLALRFLGVGPGDEVFASTLTFIGSISPATFLGADPVFIDCNRHTWNMDPDLLEAELAASEKRGRLPKAVVPTDLYGQCCNYDRIFSICNKYGVPVVVDAAESMGATCRQQHAGKGARAAVFSFNGNKIMTTSGGGMLASDDQEMIEKAKFWAQQAREPFIHYEHKEIGYNYRMSNILAAIGRGQLRMLNDRVKRKREIFDYYRASLEDIPGIEFMPEAEYGRCNRWLTVVLISPEVFGTDREVVRQALAAENIESRPVWKPMHLQPVFINTSKSADTPDNPSLKTQKSRLHPYPCRVAGGTVAEYLFNRGLCLPSGTAMTRSDLDRIIDIIRRCRS